MSATDVLLEPVDLGPLRMRNRLAMSAHTGALPADRYLGYLSERSAGGVGLIVVGGANGGVAEYGPLRGLWSPGTAAGFDFVGPNPATAAGQAYYDEVVIPPLRERADAVRAGGALGIGQIFHLGAYREVDNLHVGIGPSAGPDPDGFGSTYALSPAEIEELVVAYAAGVRRTKLAGLDGAEIHAAHGFLINAFLAPATNARRDQWGGDVAGRARFLVRILETSREQVGPDYPLGVRIAADDRSPGGLSTADLIDVCRLIEPYLAYVSVSGGTVSGVRGSLAYASTRFDEPGHNLPVAAALRAALTVPVMAAGRILTPERAAAAVTGGSCDVVAMARPFIADPRWVRKLATGRAADIRGCIGANECHMYHGFRSHMTCAVNPRAGREREWPEPAPDRTAAATATATATSVLVIGAGPAGLEAAAVAARAGHRVRLVDRASQLGGRLPVLAADPSQDRLLEYLDYHRRRLDRLGVELRLGAELSPAELLADEPAVVIVATGSEDPADPVPHDHSIPMLAYARVLAGAPVGARALVVGGLEDHLETLAAADLLSARGHQVVAVTEWERFAPHADPMTRTVYLRRLRRRGVVLAAGARVLAVVDAAPVAVDVLIGDPWPDRFGRPFDTVVWCGARVARTALAEVLRGRHPRVLAIGDCLAPRRIVHAVLDGHRAARGL
jgi:2,4-dienoyl-CoA reductase-like NADH-dependent reductase (Old Yellow Enzyme family)